MSLVSHSVSVILGDATVLMDVDVAFKEATVTALLGPNGAGKSTLLRVLSGAVHPREGRVQLNGRAIGDYSLGELAAYRAVMTQSNAVAFDFSVREILEMGWIAGSNAERARALERVAAALALEPFLNRQFNRLSGGEQQRVQYARVLLQTESRVAVEGPRYLLLDEPTASLDLRHELLLLHSARCYAARGFGVIVALHDLNLAARFADRLVLLSGGHVAADGPVEAVLNAELLTGVYGLPLRVERNQALDRLLVHS